ncbi:MAG: nucleoside phosphorylase [Gammaproteobacteria bacterium]|nr:nucleoside phosphorylase [Gammaproteobacteria bacterium]
MKLHNFKPEHMNATADDFLGNGDIGRYVFFPGSDGRAREISEHFIGCKVKTHPRGHNLYTGTLAENNKKVEVAAISSGMGTPSLDIIINELVRLGVKRLLRVGTAGTLQPKFVKSGELVIATAAVRDEGTSKRYMPAEFPAIASYDVVLAAQAAAKKLNGLIPNVHTGIIHSKDSLYAEEFAEDSPLSKQNKEYMDVVRNSGVLASEMESSIIFILTSVFNYLSKLKNNFHDCYNPANIIKSGTICVVLGEGEDFGTPDMLKKMDQDAIRLSLQTIIELSQNEL